MVVTSQTEESWQLQVAVPAGRPDSVASAKAPIMLLEISDIIGGASAQDLLYVLMLPVQADDPVEGTPAWQVGSSVDTSRLPGGEVVNASKPQSMNCRLRPLVSKQQIRRPKTPRKS